METNQLKKICSKLTPLENGQSSTILWTTVPRPYYYNKHDSGGGGQKYQSMCDVIYGRPLSANFASTEIKITVRYFRRL